MDGFFASSPPRPHIDHTDESVDRFAQAIANRFNNSDKPLLTARLTPSDSRNDPTPVAPRTPAHNPGAPDADSHTPARPPLPFKLSLPATPLARMTLSSPPKPNKPAALPAAPAAASSSSGSSQFTVITASSLPDLLRTHRILILDIRPHSAYSTSRLPHAISLSVPSTLLKRPAFTLQKLSTMLSSSTARNRFQNWKSASRILVYDADSIALAESSNLLGLLRKFRAEGYTGDVAWLKGGIQALWRDYRHLLDQCSVSDDEDEGDSPRFLRARNLPLAAFQQASTTTSTHAVSSSTSPVHANTPLQTQNQSAAAPLRPHSRAPSQALSASPTRLTAANPFYDNIRQNLELSHGITERIPLKLSPRTASRTHELPLPWLREIATAAGREDSTEALAIQFYKIELDEQRRLQNVMAHHTKQSHNSHDKTHDEKNKLVVQQHSADENSGFPYSILAGVEKGTKNRYRNIWPFEHSRVRLKGVDGDDDDYINASFVQPLGTRRQYIATQGPLPSTFADFWAIVWEQNVRVIVMLTREFEGASVKCGRYWAGGQHGPFRLKRIAISGAPEEDEDKPEGASAAGGFFDTGGGGPGPGAEDLLQQHNHTIHRVFELSHVGQPLVKPRIVHHLQYLGWPDMDVPVSPKGLLRLMFEVDELVDAANEGARGAPVSPALAHCSAGVGRTGAFIMIDAIMDGVRREIRRKMLARKAALAKISFERQKEEQKRMSDGSSDSGVNYAMDVDTTSSSREVSIGPLVPPSSDSFQGSTSSASLPTPIASAANTNTGMGAVSSAPFELSFKDSLGNMSGTMATATLPMGGTKGPDIHVPLVPSTASPSSPAQLRTPRPSKSLELTPSIGPSPVVSPFSQTPLTSSVLMSSPLISSPSTHAGPGSSKSSIYSKHRQSLFARRVLNSDFSVADADSMFTSSNPNPLFAMDVEPSFADVRQTNIASSSSSGEGNGSGSGNDRGNASSGSGSGSGGSSSSGRLVRPVQEALARLSSGEDISGPLPSSHPGSAHGSVVGHTRLSDSDSAAAFAVQMQMRIRTGSRSGSGSGSGSGESGNDASGSGSSMVSGVGSGSGSSGHRLGSSSGRGRGRGGSVTGSTGSGGYSSGSSIGIRRFEAMTTNEPSREPVEVVMQPPPKDGPTLPQQATDLFVPRPVHPLPARDLMSAAGTDTALPSPSLSKLTKANVAASALLHRHHGASQKVEQHQQQQSRLLAHQHHKSTPSTDTSSPFPSSTDISSSSFKSRTDASISTTTSETTLSTADASPSPPPPKSKHVHMAPESDRREDTRPASTNAFVDYKAPRELHGDASPPLLSTMDNPIRAILADMREQRMSLCQSLRQYVFVHCAIIEGALWILDEEREKAGLSEEEVGDLSLLGWDGRTSGEGTNSSTGSSLSTDEENDNGVEGESGTGIGMNAISKMAAALTAGAEALTASQQQKTMGKRGASPTELTKEDKKGELALAKRPSVKRGKSACSSASGSSSADSTGSS